MADPANQRAPRPIAPALRISVAILYGIACHSVFALGVGAMIGAMFVGLRPMALGDVPLAGPLADAIGVGALPAPWALGRLDGAAAVVANAALLLQFPLGHSLLLTRRGRRVLSRLAPFETGGTLSTTTYALIAGAQLALLFGLWSPSGAVWWAASGAAFWVLTGLYAAAWALLAKAMLDSGLAMQSGFLGWSALARGAPPRYPPMPTGGLYRILRHPIYASFALTLWTTPVWTPDQLAVALGFTAYCLIGPRFKEARFLAIHGAAYARWRADFPYFAPRLRPRPQTDPQEPAE